MAQALVLTVRFLDGRYHGAGAWPPSPARLFQALVAGAARGAQLDDATTAALEWLEALPPPAIAAPPARAGQAVGLFVPNNDLDAKGGDPALVGEIRTRKRMRPWLFDAHLTLLYVWELGADAPPEAAALRRLAAGLYQLGRGVDPAFATAEILEAEAVEALLEDHPAPIRRPNGGGDVAVPGPGSLASLTARHDGLRRRFSCEGKQLAFRQPPKPLFGRTGYEVPPRRMVFRLTRDGGFAPVPLNRAAWLTDLLVVQATERLASALPGHAAQVRRLLKGEGAGPADLPQRPRLVPLPSIGHAETDPSIRRVMLEVPGACPIRQGDLAWSLDGLQPHHPETGEVLDLVLQRDDTADPMADRFEGPARRWRSITPLVLSVTGGGRVGGKRRSAIERSAGHVARALRRSGVERPAAEIRVQREPLQRRGARAEAFAAGRFAAHRLSHVEIAFAEPVRGPLVLGDGRFRGLGLMVPVDELTGVRCFAIAGPEASALDLAAALRRMVMARVRDHMGDAVLHSYFTGHAPDGLPLRDGERRHIACLADPVGRRLLVIAPHLLRREAPNEAERRLWRSLDAALAGADRLVAGRTGAFDLRPEPVAEDDPLFASATTWQSVTRYRSTHHPKGGDAAAALTEDVALECHRRNLPLPRVEVLDCAAGPRGGLNGRLRLRFDVAVPGPILLGRTAMRGGGLFAAAP